MNKLNILIFCLSIIISSCKDYDEIPCIPLNLKKNISAFYSFNNGSLLDKSLEGNNLSMNGLPFSTEDRFGNKNCAYYFNTINSDHLTANGDFLNDFQNDEFSISLWYKPDSVNFQMRDYELLIGRGNAMKIICPDKHGEWSLGLYDCRRAVASINDKSIWADYDAVWKNQPNAGPLNCITETMNNTKLWKHLVLTYNNDIRIIFINGVLQSALQSKSCGSNSNNIGDLIIGKLYTGAIDDVIIFNKELSLGEVTQLYEMVPCCE